jgi:glycerol uptake facilitator protein
MSQGAIFVWELLGTAALTLFGCGVVANVVLKRTLGNNGGWLLINMGWGFAVFIGATIASPSGAHINPAVTVGLAVSGQLSWSLVPVYFAGQIVGAFIGAVLCWAAYKLQFDTNDDNSGTVGVFSTGPTVRNYAWNVVTEVIGTFVLVFWILLSAQDGTNKALGYAAVAFVVIGIGNSLGGPTGYAINPVRDLGPRLAYAILPIKGKGSANWSYAWVPVVAPLIGAVLAGLLFHVLPEVPKS